MLRLEQDPLTSGEGFCVLNSQNWGQYIQLVLVIHVTIYDDAVSVELVGDVLDPTQE